MRLSELTDRNAVLSAIAEYDTIGQAAFLAKYGYAPAQRYCLEHEGRRYDSKAIVGAAYGYQFPDRGPLAASEFSGGEATVRPLLEGLQFTVIDKLGGVSLTAADIRLIRESRSRSKFAELSDEQRAAYQRVHASLASLGALVQSKLGSGDFSLKLTSGFSPKSGVRGYLPKDLWFAVSNVRNEAEFERMPQLFMIVSDRGIDYGFAACIPPRQFSDQTIQQRVRAAAPEIFSALPAPGSAPALEWQQRLDQSGGWFFRREPRADPGSNDFNSLNEWLSFLKSPDGIASAGGSISRYLSLEDLSASGERLKDLAGEMAATFFAPMHQVVPSATGAATSSIQRGLETFLSRYKAVQESVPFGQHDELKELFNQIRSSLEQLPSVRAHPNVRVSWSLGSGNWAKIPWIALADDRETSSTQRGRYGAFLFPEDMSGVYLTLNQGVTEVIDELGRPKARLALRDRAQEIRTLVRDRLSPRFNLDDGIDLRTEGTLGQDYETSTIAYRLYKRGELPDDTGLNQDLTILLDAYAEILDQKPPEKPTAELRPPYTVEDFSAESAIPQETIELWLKRLKRKQHLIFQGPPGTGKTYVAERLARVLTGNTYGFVETVQFHPSYGYEDFMHGIRPVVQHGQMVFERMPGRFLEFCKSAQRVKDGSPCVLIIDEVNRGNLSRILGELMYLLEYRDKTIRLAGEESLFGIPRNVYIIGTMNTADRSIAIVDHALRRRFSFIYLAPDYAVLRRHLENNGLDADGLIKALQAVNAAIDDRNYEIGISFFLRDGAMLRATLKDIWEGEIEPYLEEYFYDQPSKLEPLRWQSLSTGLLSSWNATQ